MTNEKVLERLSAASAGATAIEVRIGSPTGSLFTDNSPSGSMAVRGCLGSQSEEPSVATGDTGTVPTEH